MAGHDPQPPVEGGTGSYPSIPDGNVTTADKSGGQSLPGLNPGEHPV
ncbi:hypothetical protein HF639_07905, partial [Acidithiobacillus ferridurans]|nr:hypothetical protein [Acidithiobacillus ferridurans]